MGSAFKQSASKVVILFSGCDAQIIIEQGERLKIAACEETDIVMHKNEQKGQVLVNVGDGFISYKPFMNDKDH